MARLTANQVARLVKKAYVADGGDLADEGYRIRVTKECRGRNQYTLELGSWYFYQSQASMGSIKTTLEFYAKEQGLTVELVGVSPKRFGFNSWCTQLFEVTAYRN